MGTRGLTVVIKDGRHRVAQYGQWDHYPGGQGVTALNFLRGGGLTKLEANLDKVEWLSDEHYSKATDHITEGREWITFDQSAEIDKIFPYISRNHGAEILSRIANAPSDATIHLRDEIEFVNDSLFNEGTYVIDLDARVFEVYDGFQTEPHTAGRFAKDTDDGRGYYPVKLIRSYPLDDLPTVDEFIDDLAEAEG